MKVNVSSTLGQHYVCATPTKLSGHTGIMVGTNGQLQCTAIGENDKLWLSLYKQNDQTGSILYETDISSLTNTLHKCVDDTLTMFCAGLNTVKVIEQIDEKITEKEIPTSPPVGAQCIENIITLNYGGKILLGVLFKLRDNRGYKLSYCWYKKDAKLNYNVIDYLFSTTDSQWIESDDSIFFMGTNNGNLISYDIFEEEFKEKKLADNLKIKSIKTSGDKLFGLLSNNSIADINFSEDNLSINSSTIFITEKGDNGENYPVTKFEVAYSTNKAMMLPQIFAVVNNNLYHTEFSGKKGEVALMIEPNIESISLDHSDNSGSNVHIITTERDKSGKATMKHLYYQDEISQWNKQNVIVSAKKEMRKEDSFNTEITFTDGQSPMSFIDIKIRTVEASPIYINHELFHSSPDLPIIVKTNLGGKLSVAQMTDNFCCSDFIIDVIQDLENASNIVVSPSGIYKQKFSDTTADELSAAQKNDGSSLINYDFATEEEKKKTLGNMSDALKTICNTSLPQRNNLLCLERMENDTLIKHNNPFVVSRYKSDPISILRGIPNIGALKEGFVLSFDNGKITFEHKTTSELMEERSMLYQQVTGKEAPMLSNESNSFSSFFKSLFRSIANGIVKVAKLIVTVIDNVVSATVNFFTEFIQDIKDFVVKCATDIFNFVKTCFSQLKVFFTDLFDWLAMLFNWDDIKAMAGEARNKIDDCFVKMRASMSSITEDAIKSLKDFKDKLDDGFDKIIEQLSGGDFNPSKQKDMDPQSPQGIADNHNTIKNEFVNNSHSISASSFALQSSNSAIEDFVNKLVASAFDTKEVENAFEYFKKTLSTADFSLKNLIIGGVAAIRCLADIAINGVVKILEVIKEGINLILDCLQKQLDSEIYIPVVSELVHLFGGKMLSYSTLICYMVAIPATVISKIVHKKSICELSSDNTAEIIAISFSSICYCTGGINDWYENYTENLPTFLSTLLTTISVVCGLVWFYAAMDYSHLTHKNKEVKDLAISFFTFGTLVAIVDVLSAGYTIYSYCYKEGEKNDNTNHNNNDNTNQMNTFGYKEISKVFLTINGVFSLISGIIGVIYEIAVDKDSKEPQNGVLKMIFTKGNVMPSLVNVAKTIAGFLTSTAAVALVVVSALRLATIVGGWIYTFT